MFIRACTFRKVLEGTSKKWDTKYLFLGDLNTMGMEYPYGKSINAKILSRNYFTEPAALSISGEGFDVFLDLQSFHLYLS